MSDATKLLPLPDLWFEEWFRSEYYLKLYSHRNRREAEACVDLILRATGIDPRSGSRPRVLDLACGPGRHAISLAERGFDVTAVDLSPTLLEYAGAEAAKSGVWLRLRRSDMRDVDFRDEFDLTVQLFTSFGYFESHEDDRKVLCRVECGLRSGGYYALDLLNEGHIRRNLVHSSARSFEGGIVREDRYFENDRVVKRIRIPIDGEEREYRESVRLFSPEQIDWMLRRSDLTPCAWYGEYDGSPFDPENSRRMFIISRKD